MQRSTPWWRKPSRLPRRSRRIHDGLATAHAAVLAVVCAVSFCVAARAGTLTQVRETQSAETEFLSDVLRDWRRAKKAGVPDTAARVLFAKRGLRVADVARGRERYEALRFVATLDGARPSVELLDARDRAIARVIDEYCDDGDMMGEFVLRVLRDDAHDQALCEQIQRTTRQDAVRAACQFRPLEPLLDRALDGAKITAGERDRLSLGLERIAESYGDAKHPLSTKTWREFAEEFGGQVRCIVLVGDVVPEIVDSRDPTRTPRLLALRGKPVLLSFWGEWCQACKPLFARQRALVQRGPPLGLELLGVNSDVDASVFEAALARERPSWPNVWDGADGTAGANATRWRIRGWPTWCLIDAQGVLRNRWQGAPDEAELETALAQLSR